MTEQEKHDKVIKGLELCLTPNDRREYDDADVCHAECPYFRAYNMGDCVRALAKDALTLLKAQEPRVMTLEEIKALPDYVFLEDRDISHAFSVKTISRPALPQLVFVNTSGEECVGFRGPDGDTSLVSSRYGVEWRCWTSRPDQATREAVKWDAQEQRDYEAAVEMAEYCERYEPTYNADDGSM